MTAPKVLLKLKQKILRRLTKAYRDAQWEDYRRMQQQRFNARKMENRPWDEADNYDIRKMENRTWFNND